MEIKKYIRHPSLFLLKLDKKNIIRINDKKYIQLEFLKQFNRLPNLDNPESFNEKLQWLKIYDRNPLYSLMVDKYEVKKYVANIIGNEYIIPTIGIYDHFDDIDFENLPNRFVIKCTHDSGSVVICNDKKSFDIKKAKERINKYLKREYYYEHREWPYKNVKPRILVEKSISSNKQLMDYKIMCFNGNPLYSFVCTDRFNKSEGLAVTFFDLEWNKMPFKRHYRVDENVIEKPEKYNEMIELSKKLSEDIPFLRVDFYEVNGKIYFGELTFFPGGGLEEFTPEEWDYKLGSLIDLGNINKKVSEKGEKYA